MGQVSASSTVLIDAEPDRGGRSRGLRLVRPKILPALQQLPGARGRAGAGSVATWKLQATESRMRDVKANRWAAARWS